MTYGVGNPGPDLQREWESCEFDDFTTIYPISAYRHQNCEFGSCSWQGAVSDLQQISGFLQALRFPPPIKLTTMI